MATRALAERPKTRGRSPLMGVRERARGYISHRRYHLPLGYSLPPRFIFLHMTSRCNLRCSMCEYWGVTGSRKEMPAEQLNRDFTKNQLLRIVEDLAAFRPTVCLFGGEPLLHAEVRELLPALAERGLPTQIITNGVLLEKYAADIVANRVQQVAVSIDGPGEIHDSIRGVRGTFERLRKGFHLVRDIKVRSGSPSPVLIANFTLHSLNLPHLDEMLEVVASLRPDKMRINHQFFTTADDYQTYLDVSQHTLDGECKSWKSLIRDLPLMNLNGFHNSVGRLRSGLAEMGIEFVEYPVLEQDELHGYYSTPGFQPTSFPPRCVEPWYVASITSDGNIWGCPEIDYNLGNVLDTPFLEIWNNKRARRFRSELRRQGMYSVCRRCCGLYRTTWH